MNIKKILAATALAASTVIMTTPANSFWGPFDWFDNDYGPGWGGPWGGYPGYYGGPWGGYPGYGYGYPGYGYGYPGYGYGYPGYGYGYPAYGYGYPYYTTPVVPSTPAPTK